MVLRHASEKFRLAYELPLDTNELFGAFAQFFNVTAEKLDENTYRADLLAKYDVWRTKSADKSRDELIDYEDLNEDFYDSDRNDDDAVDYNDDVNEEESPAMEIYKWHRNRHFDSKNTIIKYVDDKMYGSECSAHLECALFPFRINISVLEFVRNLPQFDRNNYQSARLPFDLFLPYAYLLEEKYRGRAGNAVR